MSGQQEKVEQRDDALSEVVSYQLLMLSEGTGEQRKRGEGRYMPISSGEEEFHGSSDEDRMSKRPKHLHPQSTSLDVLINVEQNNKPVHPPVEASQTSSEAFVSDGSFAGIPSTGLYTTDNNQSTLLPISPVSEGSDWMRRYNNVRKTLSCALYPSAEDVQWLNEQIGDMRKGTLSPERSELLKQAINIIAFNSKTSAGGAPASKIGPIMSIPSDINSFERASPEHPHLVLNNKKMRRNQLSSWMCTQRQDKKSGELPEYRIKLLDLIGFVWSKQHKTKHGKDGSDITNSVQLALAEQDILNTPYVLSLGGRAKRNHDLWIVRYQELIQFKRKYGHLKVPTLIPDE